MSSATGVRSFALRILGCGTSTGVPVVGCTCAVCTSSDPRNTRTRTSAIILGDRDERILIDASTDLRFQALAAKLNRVDAVLFTHAHADHIFGIDDLRAFNFISRRSIPMYCSAHTATGIRYHFAYVFEPSAAYEGGMLPQLTLEEFTEGEPLQVAGVSVLPFPLLHGKLPVSGFRVGNLAYATDCSVIPPQSQELLKGITHLVLDGLRYEPHKTHLSIPEAVELAQQLGAKNTYFIHMNHSIDYATENARLPSGMQFAYDGMEIGFEA